MRDNELLRLAGGARFLLALTVFLGILGAMATIAQMALLSTIVARVFLDHQNLARVMPAVMALLGALLARAIVSWCAGVIAQQGASRVKIGVRDRVVTHLMRLGPAFVGDEHAGELVTTTVEGVERLDPYYRLYLPQVALSVLVPLIIAGSVLPWDWISATILVGTAPVILIVMIAAGSYTRQHAQRQWTALSSMSAHFLDTLQGLPTLRLFSLGKAQRNSVARVSEEYGRRTLKVLRLAFISGLVLEGMTAVSIGLIAVELGVRLLRGAIAFQPAFMILLLTPEFYKPLRDLGAHRHAAMEGRAAAERLFAILHMPVPLRQDQASVPPRIRLDGPPAIELSALTYHYPTATTMAIDGVSMTLAAGTRTALVGPSGSGKSTIVNLLMRFLDPQSGAMTVDGQRIDALSVDDWRAMIALIPQRPYLFAGTIRDNIALTRPQATPREIERAAALAGAAEFIACLPRGYETPVGERGTRLSGGQAQRVAIARAFLKDAPLLIMDEPTSNLDPLGEDVVRQALARLMEGRTVLVVAHRLNTVRDADQIIVLDRGRIQEQGRHDDLLARNGAYARLVQAPHEVLA